MLDIKNIEKYRENNRIEAKKALGGLPGTIWETYSAFANTLGGVILLGMEEHRDHSLHAVALPEPEEMALKLRALLNNPRKASVNLLSVDDIRIETVEENKKIIVIYVPRASRYDKPVYVDGDIFKGTYRRCGEGDYHCGAEEISAMLRDAEKAARDILLLENLPESAIDYACLRRFRAEFSRLRPRHALSRLTDMAFLCGTGGAGRGSGGDYHPTAAGLLLFGKPEYIKKAFPLYSLSLNSDTEEQSESVYGFYCRVCEEISKSYLNAYGGEVCRALCEALANCLVNADYLLPGGISVRLAGLGAEFSNPGGFRVEVEAAKTGGSSDPRNPTLIRLFSYIDICKGGGRGIPFILETWDDRDWLEPRIFESFSPERTTLTLDFIKDGHEKAPRGIGADKIGMNLKTVDCRGETINFLTANTSATVPELAEYLSVKRSVVRAVLRGLMSEKTVSQFPGGIYKLTR